MCLQPEGETIYKNKAFFVDLRKETSFEKNITLDIPANVVPDSEFIEIGAVGESSSSCIYLCYLSIVVGFVLTYDIVSEKAIFWDRAR